MGMSTGGSGGLQSDINVTPLVDVVLVLLIIFMIVIPLTMKGYDVDIPGDAVATAEQVERQSEQIVLGIRAEHCAVIDPMATEGLPADCAVNVNDDRIPVTELTAHVAAIFGERQPEDRVLFLAAQDHLNYEGVMRILDLCKSGVDGLRIGLVVEG